MHYGRTDKIDIYEFTYFQQASRLFQEANSHMNCNSFTHPCILDFYDK